jgi:hypothetical protein
MDCIFEDKRVDDTSRGEESFSGAAALRRKKDPPSISGVEVGFCRDG